MVGMAEAGRKEGTLGYIRCLADAAGPGYMYAKCCSQDMQQATWKIYMARCTPGSSTDDSQLEVVLQQYCTHVLG